MSESEGIVIGAAIAGVIGIMTSFITNYFEKRKWVRDKLIDFYGQCIYYLIKLSLSSNNGSAIKNNDTRQHFSEAQRYLNLIQLYQTDERLKGLLQEKTKELADASDTTDELSTIAESAIVVVKEAMRNDSRVKY